MAYPEQRYHKQETAKEYTSTYTLTNADEIAIKQSEDGKLGYVSVGTLKSFTRNYGQFLDLTTQSGSANTAYSVKLGTTDIASGVSVVSGSQITVENTGTYNLQFSAQLGNTANTTIDFDVWFAKNGTSIDNSNTQMTVAKVAGSVGRLVAAWNTLVQLNAGEYVEMKWNCTAATGQIQYQGTQTTPARPAIPSVIATITQVA